VDALVAELIAPTDVLEIVRDYVLDVQHVGVVRAVREIVRVHVLVIAVDATLHVVVVVQCVRERVIHHVLVVLDVVVLVQVPVQVDVKKDV
jgi:hypothetical protein